MQLRLNPRRALLFRLQLSAVVDVTTLVNATNVPGAESMCGLLVVPISLAGVAVPDHQTAAENASRRPASGHDQVEGHAAMTSEQCAQLDRARLEQRAIQLSGVIERLRVRARAFDAGAAERSGLQRAAGDFARELAQVRQRLNDRDGDRPRLRSDRVRSRAA